MWEVDAHVYTDQSVELLLATATRLAAALPEGASHALLTKIMLGVFGCVPAFDSYFTKGFGVARFNQKSAS